MRIITGSTSLYQIRLQQSLERIVEKGGKEQIVEVWHYIILRPFSQDSEIYRGTHPYYTVEAALAEARLRLTRIIAALETDDTELVDD